MRESSFLWALLEDLFGTIFGSWLVILRKYTIPLINVVKKVRYQNLKEREREVRQEGRNGEKKGGKKEKRN